MSIRNFCLISAILLCMIVPTRNAFCMSPYIPRFADFVASADSLFVAWNKDINGAQIAVFDLKTGKSLWKQTTPKDSVLYPLVVSDNALFVSTFYEGLYVRDVRSGNVRAHLSFGYSGAGVSIASTPKVVLVANSNARWTVYLKAFETQSYRSIWKRDISKSDIWEMVSEGDTFRLVITEPYMRVLSHSTPKKFESIILSAQDGSVISRKRIKQPNDGANVPTDLPNKVRQRLAALIHEQPNNLCWTRTRIERIDGCLLFGNRYDGLFSIKSDTGNVIWKRHIKGLSGIYFHDGILYVAAFERSYNGKDASKPGRLMAIQPQTGRVLWSRYVYD